MDQRQQGEASFAMAWQAGKAQGNQIVRTLESHTPEIDSSCLRAVQSSGLEEVAMGDYVFRIQLRPECDTWHYLEAGGTPGK